MAPIGMCTAGTNRKPKKMVDGRTLGLQFPLGHVATRFAKGKHAKRFTFDVPIFLTAVLEYLATEVLEVSGNAAKADNKTQIDTTHLRIPATEDEDLNKLFGDLAIAASANTDGGSPNTNNNLLLPVKTADCGPVAHDQNSLPMNEDY